MFAGSVTVSQIAQIGGSVLGLYTGLQMMKDEACFQLTEVSYITGWMLFFFWNSFGIVHSGFIFWRPPFIKAECIFCNSDDGIFRRIKGITVEAHFPIDFIILFCFILVEFYEFLDGSEKGHGNRNREFTRDQ